MNCRIQANLDADDSVISLSAAKLTGDGDFSSTAHAETRIDPRTPRG